MVFDVRIVGVRREIFGLCEYDVRAERLEQPGSESGRHHAALRRAPDIFLEIAPNVSSLNQKRTAYRASVSFDVLYTVEGRAGTRSGTASDLSAGGLRLTGDEDLAAGSIVSVHFTLPNELVRSIRVEKDIDEKSPFVARKAKIMVPPPPFEPMTIRSSVVISSFNLKRHKFAHGLQFLQVDERTKEEIRRFIHIWQVRQLRERAREPQ
ncbi:MAG: hypothetical protein NVSMB5_00810 [Candidatus Velthaea sp.]